MSKQSTAVVRSLLAAIHHSGAGRMLAPLLRGDGAIFMLHHVSPAPTPAFSPNRILSVTPDYLDAVVTHVRAAGFEIVTLDEACQRIAAGNEGRAPFACFTFDDGYRDNRDHALPVLKRHDVPFTVYVCPDFADGYGELWWLTLEEAVRRMDRIAIPVSLGGRPGETIEAVTVAQKEQAFSKLYWPIRYGTEQVGRAAVRDLAVAAGIDPIAACRSLVMNWAELRAFAAEPLVTIGAHTLSHLALGKLPAGEAQWQMAASIERIERELARSCRHVSFPYGDCDSAGPREFAMAKSLGAQSAVTTAKGMIKAGHRHALTALPRVSLNGDFQDRRYLDALLTGLPFACYDGASSMAALARRIAGRRPSGATAGA